MPGRHMLPPSCSRSPDPPPPPSTDRLYMRDGILALRPGPAFVPVYDPPPAAVLGVHRTCNDTAGTSCVMAWGPTLTSTLEQQLNNFPEKIYQVYI
jgi:hypothetical protein